MKRCHLLSLAISHCFNLYLPLGTFVLNELDILSTRKNKCKGNDKEAEEKKLCPIGYDLFCFYGGVDKGISLFDVMFGYTSSFTREILFRVFLCWVFLVCNLSHLSLSVFSLLIISFLADNFLAICMTKSIPFGN